LEAENSGKKSDTLTGGLRLVADQGAEIKLTSIEFFAPGVSDGIPEEGLPSLAGRGLVEAVESE